MSDSLSAVRCPLAVRSAVSLLAALLAASQLCATVELNVPPQPAHQALLMFSRQSGVEVLFPTEQLRDIRSPGITGHHEPEDALHRVLQGTGFVATRTGTNRIKFVVTPAPADNGSVRGSVITRDGAAVPRVRVQLEETSQSTTTNRRGEFVFRSVSPGTYRISVTAEGFQPVEIRDVHVDASRVVTLLPQILQRRQINPAQLEPFVVQARVDRILPLERGEAYLGIRTAAGNLDLARSEDDALPYTIYDRREIARSGVVNLNEFLQRELLDSDATMRPPEQDSTADVYTTGSTNLSLRGFGADETVILVNGRRLPEVLVTNQGQAQLPDVNFIPLGLVQQIEVLPISASSLYTGNPVGGVINILLRPGTDVNATEVSTTYTNAVQGFDAPQSSVSFLHARSLLAGALRVRVNASFSESRPATESELGYHARRARPPNSLEAPVYRATPYVRSPNLSPLFGPGTPPVTSVAPGADGTGGLGAFAGREGMPNLGFFKSPGGLASSLNSSDYAYGRRQRRSVFFASAVYDVTPWLQLGLEGTRGSTILNRGYELFEVDFDLRANSPFNPFRRDLWVSLNETAPTLGEFYNEARLEFSSTTVGALFTLPAEWQLMLDGQYARNVSQYRGVSSADYGRWQQLVDSGRYNPLRDTQAFGPPAEFYDRVLIYRGGRGQFVTLGDYDTLDLALRATNKALKLPTGTSTLNVGVDYRRNHLAAHLDERRYGDGTLAYEPTRWAGRTLKRYSAFAELQTPLLPARWRPSWVRKLDGDVAVRHVASNLDRESNIAPTYSLRLDLPAGLTLRASIATSSRFPTPNMSRPFVAPPVDGGSGAGAEPVVISDPIRNQTYPVRAFEALNPDLHPEAALSQTAGLVFRTGDVHRLRASLDFVDTRKVNELVFLSASDVMNLEHLMPERVQRAPLQAGDGKRAGLVRSVVTGTTNMAWRQSQNWNLSLNYAWSRCFGGTLDAYGRLLYFQRYDRQVFPTSEIVDELDEPSALVSGLMKYRGKFGAGWSNRAFGFGVDGHYFHSRVLPRFEWFSQKRDRIDRYWQFDAFVQTELGRWLPWQSPQSGLRMQLRVNNVLGTAFPAYENEPSGSGVQPYGDWRGRVYSISVTAAF